MQSEFDTNSLIRIASMSKQMSAIALLQQMELGRCEVCVPRFRYPNSFQIDDDVSSHIGFELRNPYFPDYPITLRQLLDHTSSINDYYEGSFA